MSFILSIRRHANASQASTISQVGRLSTVSWYGRTDFGRRQRDTPCKHARQTARLPEPFAQGCLVCHAFSSSQESRPGPSDEMSTLRVSGDQGRCPHPAVTFGGSNQHQTRVTCMACRQTLMLIYHSLPQRHVEEALRRRALHSGWTRGDPHLASWLRTEEPACRALSPGAPERATQSALSSPVEPPAPAAVGPAMAPATQAAAPVLQLTELDERPVLPLCPSPSPVAPDDGWCTPLSSPRQLFPNASAPTACKWCHQKPSWNGLPDEFCSTVCQQEAKNFETTA